MKRTKQIIQEEEENFSLHGDPYMVWSAIRKGSICHSCVNIIKTEQGCLLCDEQQIDPHGFTFDNIAKVQETGKCEFYIKKTPIPEKYKVRK